jgi:Ca2+-binding EF-hand superfamily protein
MDINQGGNMQAIRYHLVITLVLVLFFVPVTFLQTALSSDQKLGHLQNNDKDKDGKISQEEYPGSQASFNKMDLNQDGYLDETELQKSVPYSKAQMGERGSGYIQRFDKNQDGKLSQEEYPGPASAFQRLDSNSDGFIDANEAPGTKPLNQPQKIDRASGYIKNFDKDKDGKLSKEEYPGSESAFKRADKNSDGFIDQTEAQTHSSMPQIQPQKEKRGIGYIKNFDKDRDGKLSKEEYPGSESAFKRADKNGDGYIDETEAQMGTPPVQPQKERRRTGYVQSFDKDKDGKLSREEYPGSEAAFKRLDINGDGFVDEDEADRPTLNKKGKSE